MHARERVDEASVALVRDDRERTRLRDEEVRAGNAHVGGVELRTQLRARGLHEFLHVFVVLRAPRRLLELVRHLSAREMDRGHHHVRRTLMAQLHDPLAEVRLVHLQPRRLEVRVEADLLGGHGLRFDDLADVVLLGDGGDDLAGLRGVLRAVYHGAALLRLRAEFLVKLLHAPRRVVLHIRDALDERALVHLREHPVASRAVFDRELVQRTAEKSVLQRLFDLACVALAHCHPPISTMWSSSGPCTPIALTRSMSAVRLGPVMKEM